MNPKNYHNCTRAIRSYSMSDVCLISTCWCSLVLSRLHVFRSVLYCSLDIVCLAALRIETSLS
jgi:hypothetical protein